jgi:hypothetical protein
MCFILTNPGLSCSHETVTPLGGNAVGMDILSTFPTVITFILLLKVTANVNEVIGTPEAET